MGTKPALHEMCFAVLEQAHGHRLAGANLACGFADLAIDSEVANVIGDKFTGLGRIELFEKLSEGALIPTSVFDFTEAVTDTDLWRRFQIIRIANPIAAAGQALTLTGA